MQNIHYTELLYAQLNQFGIGKTFESESNWIRKSVSIPCPNNRSVSHTR